MSANDPITVKARYLVDCYAWRDNRDMQYFIDALDAIDSIHAQLERENASLKAELDRVLGEQEDRRSCIYYDPERHYCSCHDIDTDGLVELPKDADGKPIHVGDTVEYVDDTLAPRNVTSINLAGDGWWVYINGLGRRPDRCRHVTPDTWERIIADALGCEPYEVEGDDDLMAIVARCKALCERTKEAGE